MSTIREKTGQPAGLMSLIKREKDKYKTPDFKGHTFEFYTLLFLISLIIVLSIIGATFIIITWVKLNESSSLLALGTSSIQINKIDTCVDDCNKNLCIWDYNTVDCLNNQQNLQLGCTTKDQCYSVCVEYYRGNVDMKCFGNT